MKRKIFLVTERRADYSRFKPILKKIEKDSDLDYDLVVTGIHLLKKYGHTIDEIKKDGFKIFSTFKMFEEEKIEDTGAEMVRSLGRAITNITYELEKSKPDIILSGFDIAANFAVTIAGAHMNIPVVHIQGGEVTGTIDESLRHAMSKFSHYHFVANDDARKRLIKMGEIPEHVFVTGCPSIDAILQVKEIPKEELEKEFNLDLNKPFIIIIQHPVTSEINEVTSQIIKTLEAVKELNMQAILIYPNNDAGAQQILNVIEKTSIKQVSTLFLQKYVNLLKHAKALVGNSSGGIHETATFHIPTVNIGTRQQGRLRPDNVLDVGHDKDEIKKAILKTLNDKIFLEKVAKCNNPYGDGTASEKIINLLKKIDISSKIIQKKITY